MKMIKIFKVSLLLIFYSNCFSQPGFRSHATIQIQSMFKGEKQLFKKGDGSIQFNRIYLENEKGITDVGTSTVASIEDHYDNFIYKNDTMRVKIILPKYFKLEYIKIKELKFVKGDYNIDMLEYIKERHDSRYNFLIINNFPEDCLPYRKEEEGENSYIEK